MKAVYINLDPYLAAFAAWLKGGKSGPAPSFDPLPLAVTIPLGETAAIYLPDAGTSVDDIQVTSATIDGQTVYFSVVPDGTLPEGSGDVVAYQNVPGLSALAPSAKYAVVKWDAWASENGATIPFYIGETDTAAPTFSITVLVRRETASGPVDLVDFTPPSAALTAAAINTALGGAGAVEGAPLAGVSLGRANIVATNEDGATTFTVYDDSDPIIIKADSGASLGAALGASSAST